MLWTAHPEGASPFGVMDMVGNVWQWTEEFVDEHTRGASCAAAAIISRRARSGIFRRPTNDRARQAVADVAQHGSFCRTRFPMRGRHAVTIL